MNLNVNENTGKHTSEDTPKRFSDAVKSTGIVKSALGLVKTVIWAVIMIAVSVYLKSIGIPVIIGIAIIAVFAALVLVEAVKLKRARSVDTWSGNAYGGKNDSINNQITVGQDEVLENYIAGIWRYGQGAGSYSVLETGKNFTPENALLITNKSIWAVTVPLDGSGKVMSGTDISKWQWMTMQKHIEVKLREMMKNMALEELINSCGKSLQIQKENISGFKSSDLSNGITIITRDHKKYSYSIRNKEDYLRAKKLLAAL